MIRYISILRGINVGGRKTVRMADLALLYQQLGFTDVSTYIQSGNVIFNSDITSSIDIEESIERIIYTTYGFEVPVILRSCNELQKISRGNPFILDSHADIDKLYLTFLKNEPSPAKSLAIKDFESDIDKFELRGKEVYLYCGQRYSDTKYSNNFFESKLGVSASTRNWKTVIKLLELAKVSK